MEISAKVNVGETLQLHYMILDRNLGQVKLFLRILQQIPTSGVVSIKPERKKMFHKSTIFKMIRLFFVDRAKLVKEIEILRSKVATVVEEYGRLVKKYREMDHKYVVAVVYPDDLNGANGGATGEFNCFNKLLDVIEQYKSSPYGWKEILVYVDGELVHTFENFKEAA